MEKWIGNSLAKDQVRRILDSQNLTGPILLSGIQGIGKFSYLLEEVKLRGFDFSVVNHSDGIDGIRQVINECQFLPRTSHRIIIIRDVHSFSDAAQDGLLKILEEAPNGSVLFLVSDDPELMNEPIRSRIRTKINWNALTYDELREISSDDLAIKSSFGSASDCVKATSLSGLKELYELSKSDWYKNSVFGSVPKILKDVGSDVQIRRCIANVFKLASRESINSTQLLELASSVVRVPSLNIYNKWVSSALSTM